MPDSGSNVVNVPMAQRVMFITRLAIGLIIFVPVLIFNIRQVIQYGLTLEEQNSLVQRLLLSAARTEAELFNAEDRYLEVLINDAVSPEVGFLIEVDGATIFQKRMNTGSLLLLNRTSTLNLQGHQVVIRNQRSLADRLPLMLGVTSVGFFLFYFFLWAFRTFLFRQWFLVELKEMELRERFEYMVLASDDWFWETGDDFSIRISSCLADGPFNKRDCLGQRFWELPGLEAEIQWYSIRHSLMQHLPVVFRVMHGNKDNPIWYELRGKPFFQTDGKLNGYRGLGRDITSDMARQRELELHREDLKNLVDQQTLDLIEARAKAEEASKAKSMFIANMSHELRTPMNAIIGLSQLMMRTDLSTKQKGYLDTISNSSELLLSTINDILDISKIEAGKLQLVEESFLVGDLIEEVVALILPRARSKGIEIIVDITTLSAQGITGDRTRLGQSLLNLLSNSVKFTEKGHILLRTILLPSGKDGHSLEISVSDTGIGMSAEQQARVFHPFEQADKSTSRTYGGTGLGLSILKRIVDLMGGEVGMASEVGAGTTFFLRIPVRIVDKDVPLAPESELESPAVSDLKVLVVDDNPVVLEVLANLLSRKGFRVATAGNAWQAMQMVQTNHAEGSPYSVVIVDWQMPEVDGLSLLRRIRREAGSPMPRLVCMTAFSKEDLQDVAEAGDYELLLEKPLTERGVTRQLVSVLQNSVVVNAAVPERKVASLAGMRVLVADDDVITQRLVSEVLGQSGVVCEVVDNGQKVLDLLQGGEKFDVVLMDIEMPVMDGLTATLKLRADETSLDIPVIALTANALSHQQDAYLAAGFDEFISKPFYREDILGKLAEYYAQIRTGEKGVDIRKLCLMLDAGDAGVLDWVGMHDSQLRALIQGEYSRFVTALRNYDFDTAATLVRRFQA